MIEGMIREFWRVTAKLRSMITAIPGMLFRANAKIHQATRKLIGEGITALCSTATTAILLAFVWLVFFSGYKITIKDAATALAVDAKVAYHTKKAGLW